MATVVKMGGKDKRDKPKPAASRTAEPASGLAGITLTPLMAVGIIAALIVVASGLWFAFGRGPAAGSAASTMMDTSSETAGGGASDASQHANGMDTGTGSGAPSTSNNGIDTGTGQ